MYRVLIADGEPLMREALSVMVGRVEGFTAVRAVSNGEAAVAFCQTDSVDIAFLSAVMPALSGLEAAKRIHTAAPTIPLVLVGAEDTVDCAKAALRLNISGYVSKPVSSAVVRDILLEHKARHAVRSPQLVEAFLETIAARDFFRAYQAIPAAAADIRARAGVEPCRRFELLAHISQRFLAALEEESRPAKSAVSMVVFGPDKLGVDSGVDLSLFYSLEHVFRRSCISAYPVLEPVFAFIDRNITEKIGLEDIVGHCAASQTHVSKIVKKYFSLSVMDYLHLRKLHLAKVWFSYTGQSAADAAFALGYNEAGYFSKVFKKYEKSTVQQYRTSLQSTLRR